MATTNIELDIENVTGVSDADDQFVKSAQKFVVSSIPKNLLHWAGTSTASATHGGDDSPTAVTLPQPTDNILDVQRNGFSAEEVPESMQGFIANSSSMHLATKTYPKYYTQAGSKVVVKPDPTASETVLVNYVDFLKIDDDSDLRNAVVFHACAKEFTQLATSAVPIWSDVAVPIAPVAPDFGSDLSINSIGPSSPTISTVSYSDATNADSTASTIGAITVASVSKADISGDVPTYTKPSLTTRVSFDTFFDGSTNSFGDSDPGVFTISVVAPIMGSINTVSYTDATNADASASSIGAITVTAVSKADISGNAPAYTKPTLTTQTSFNDFFESGSKNPFDDSDPGAFSISEVAPTVPTITASTVSFSQTAPTYTKPVITLSDAPSISNLTIKAIAPAPPTSPSISGGSVGAITIDALPSAPDYTTPTTTISGVVWATEYPSEASAITTALTAINANVDLANATVDVIPVPPDSPTLSTGTSVSFSTSAPVYTAPAITTTGSDSTSVDLTKLDTATWTALDYDFDDENIDPLKWFQVAGDMIQNEEDPELAQVQLQKIATYIQAYSTAMQNQLNKFNDANAEYQIEFQKSLKNADFDNEEDARLLQKYQAELGVYQGEIAAMSAQSQGYLQTAQGYASEVQTRLSSAQIKVSEYQARVKDALNVFNEGNAVYQAAIQRNLQQAQIDMQDAQKEADLTLQASIQDYTLELQLFQQKIAKYQAEVTDEVQEYQQNLQGDLQVWQAERQTDLQKYASDIQNELNEYNKENAVYQVELKKSIENAQLESAEEAQKLQKYSGEIQEYQAKVVTEVQEYQAKMSRYQLEVGTAYTAWQQTEADNIAVFQADIQNELNEFNKENSIYQANIQAELAKHSSDLQKVLTQAQLDATDAQQEASLTTDVSKFNKAQDQALALQNAAKQIEDVIADNGIKIQKYQAELQNYQNDINGQVQQYTQKLSRYQSELQSVIAAWSKTEDDSLQQYQLDIQNELNEFNKDNVRYQANIQAELAKHNSDLQKALNQAQLDAQDAQQEASLTTDVDKFNKAQDQVLALANAAKQIEDVIADNGIKIQKYSAELQSYQADVNKEVQDFTNTLNKEVQEYQSKVALYTADLQKYQAEVASETQKTALNSQKAQVYAVEADKYYKWAVAEVQSYVQNNSKMIGMQMASQSQQRR